MRTSSVPVPAPTPVLFKAIRSTRAFEEIATQIRTELAQGRLVIGSRLPSERALAEQFGVSRNTLREALRSLEHAGLLRLQKGPRAVPSFATPRARSSPTACSICTTWAPSSRSSSPRRASGSKA